MKEVVVSGTFMEMLVVKYSAQLGVKEVQKELRGYTNKNYNTRKLKKELRKIYNELLAADNPAEIKKLRARFIQIRGQIADILEAKNKDPKVKELKLKSKVLRDSIAKLDEAIVKELKAKGYEVKPLGAEEVKSKVRELIPEPRDTPVKSDDKIMKRVAGTAKP